MSLFKNIAFTAQDLAPRPLLEQLARVVELERPDALVLREKSLCDEDYYLLAQKVQKFCMQEGIPFFCNGHVMLTRILDCQNIQLSMHDLECHAGRLSDFDQLWVSVHSLEEATRAQELGAHALIFGHVYLTDCKKGLPARGIAQLREIVLATCVPVFAIGGIRASNFAELQAAGATGACRMSHFMEL